MSKERKDYFEVQFYTPQEIEEFVKKCYNRVESDVYVESGQYRVDGKSLLGMLSLSHSNPVRVYCGIEEDDYALADIFEEIFGKVNFVR